MITKLLFTFGKKLMHDSEIPSRIEAASLILMAVVLPLIIKIHLLPALLAGLLVHELVHMLAPRLLGTQGLSRAKFITLSILLVIIMLSISLTIMGIVWFLRSDAGSLPVLLEKLAGIIERTRETLPSALQQWIPTEASDLKDQIVSWLRDHAREIQATGGAFGHAVVVSIIGMVIGGLVSLREADESDRRKRSLATSLTNCMSRLAMAFRRIVFAQLRISTLNTALTAIYLVVILHIAGITLPLTKTMLLITFLAGLLPVVGNLISNTVIVIISLSYSLPAAAASLLYLVLIHKLEYFVNARIVGNEIHASAWELLSAMLIMEALFGVPGVVAAPIYYAYCKNELTRLNLV